jgi:glucose-6-phosphate 1-dehydrogenase
MTCEVPSTFSNDALRQSKVDLLAAIPPISTSSPEELVLGQYTAGKEGGNGEEKQGYREDETVPDDSKTATFSMFKMEVDNDRWRGVPIVVKTGKGTLSFPPSVVAPINKLRVCSLPCKS